MFDISATMDDHYTSSILVSNELLTILSAEDDELKLLEELVAIQDEIQKLREDRIAAIKRDIEGIIEVTNSGFCTIRGVQKYFWKSLVFLIAHHLFYFR